MADLIRIKGGSGNVPTLQDRELAYRKETKELYIGTDNGNVRLCGKDDKELLDTLKSTVSGLQSTIATINATIDAIKLTIQDITTRLEALEPDETPSE